MIPIKDVKPVLVGNSYYFRCPSSFIRNGLVKLDGKYLLNVDRDWYDTSLILSGRAYFFLIRSDLIDSGVVREDQKYNVWIEDA
jgi:hypothetical protein